MRVFHKIFSRTNLLRGAIFLMVAFAAWTVFSTVFWVIRSYTPVPTWDMWTGYVDFSVSAHSGDHGAWWRNHNEHRLLIPKVLFYADFWLFQGRGVFLLCATIVALVFCAGMLTYGAEQIIPRFRARRPLLLCICLVLVLSWQQQENLTWAFQIQFVLVYAFALLACLVFAKAANKSDNAQVYFWLAAFLAVCSAACMASGLLVLPMLAFWAFWINSLRRWGLVLALASVLMWWAYFNIGYSTSSGNLTLAHALTAPTNTARYIFAYLGASVRNYSLNWSMLFGGVYVALLTWLVAGGLRRTVNLTTQPLFWFALFILASGVVVAVGRVQHGVEQAMSSRYATPAILGWCCLMFQAIACATTLRLRVLFLAIFTVHTALVMWQQQFARIVPYSILFLHRQAALSLALGAHDRDTEGDLLWDVDFLAKISAAPRKNFWTVFGVDWLAEPTKRLGKNLPIDHGSMSMCLGEFESLTWRGGVLVAEGWQAGWRGNQSSVMFLVDDSGRVVGGAVSGKPRVDVHLNVKERPKNPGWVGYVTLPALGRVRALLRQSSGDYCRLGVPILLPVRPE